MPSWSLPAPRNNRGDALSTFPYLIPSLRKVAEIPWALSPASLPCFALIHCMVGCATRMNCYAHHRRTQHPPVKHIRRLEHFQNGAVHMLGRLRAVHCLMHM